MLAYRAPYVAAAALVALLVGATAIAGAQPKLRSNSAARFSDPRGDARGAPDVVSVVVTRSAHTQIWQFTVTARHVMSIDGARKPDVDIYIDTDRNSHTGRSGYEYDVYFWRDKHDWGWDINRWKAGRWREVPESSEMSFDRSGDTLTWELGPRDLGGASGLRFYVNAAIYNAKGKISASDDAPDAGTWSYPGARGE